MSEYPLGKFPYIPGFHGMKEEKAMDKLVEKIAKELAKIDGRSIHSLAGLDLGGYLEDAEQVIQAIKSDPSIVEIEVGAELPKKLADEINDMFDIWALRPAFARQEVGRLLKEANWVKKKDGGRK